MSADLDGQSGDDLGNRRPEFRDTRQFRGPRPRLSCKEGPKALEETVAIRRDLANGKRVVEVLL